MAGILDKKTRVFDYILTREGRSQLKDEGDLRFVYATVSDRGLEYTSKQSINDILDQDSSQVYTNSSLKISDTERFYLGFEATSTYADKLNPEYSLLGHFSYPKLTQDTLDFHGLDNFDLNKSFDEITANVTGSFAEKIQALKIIDTNNQIESEDILINNQDTLKNIIYDFKEYNLSNYPTIFSKSLNLDKERILKDDLRFSHKNNFKKLIPVNKDGSQLFESQESSDTINGYNYIFKKYKKDVNLLQNESRSDAIKKLILALEDDISLFKTTLEITNPTENDLWITQIYESHENSSNLQIKELNKLAAIDLGEFYFEDQKSFKHVFLYGKIYKKSSMANMKNNNEHDPVYKKEFVLSQEYSFVNIFTLVIE